MSTTSRTLPLLTLTLALVGGLAGGFVAGRISTPSDLATLSGLLGTKVERPAPLARGVDNDGQIALAVDSSGVLDKAGVNFVEKSGPLALAVRNDADAEIILIVARAEDLTAGLWVNVYSTRIDAGENLIGALDLQEKGAYRITTALATSPDRTSEAKLAIWTPE